MNKIFLTLLFSVFARAACALAQVDTAKVDFGDAVLHGWVRPEYPEAALKKHTEGEVVVEFVVESDGRVSHAVAKKSSDEIFADAAVGAVSQWTFNPAVDNGKPVASAMMVRVPFAVRYQNQKPAPVSPPGGEFMPVSLPAIAARVKSVPDPDYPDELTDRKLPGEVEIEFTVNEEGKSSDPKVVVATNAAFIESALRALEKAQFEPAHQGSVPKSSVMHYPMAFESMGAKRVEVLAANGVTVVGDSTPDSAPGVIVMIEPVYPFSKLVAGESGSAEAEFSIDEKGWVTASTLTNASAPEFGAALSAAVDAWIFKPAGSGNNQPMKLKVVHQFTPPTEGPVARLLPNLQPNGAGVAGATGLDRKIKPLWRGFPVYPQALRAEGPSGDAKIEFIIDQAGRVRTTRIVSASREEFGWAAATAISQWVFERPTRKGEPTDVRVMIPVGFKPPKE